MEKMFKEYLAGLYKDIPCYVYEGLLGVFVIGTVVLLACRGLKNGWRWSVGLLLLEYIVLIYCSTVVFRATGSERKCVFTPFWSYGLIMDGDKSSIVENVMNVMVFVPLGLLLGLLYGRIKWWQALLIGCGVSVSIEMLQFFFVRGFAEVDDVIHNTTGCMIGYMMACGVWLMVHGLKRSRIAG